MKKVTLTKDYFLNGILKPAGIVLMVTKQKSKELEDGGYIEKPKRKKVKIETTNIK